MVVSSGLRSSSLSIGDGKGRLDSRNISKGLQGNISNDAVQANVGLGGMLVTFVYTCTGSSSFSQLALNLVKYGD